MSRSLEAFTADIDAARALGERLANGQTVMEIDASLIDTSIVPDRMKGTDEDHRALVRSIGESGQLVPVLLRPHPSDRSRFQTAFGHRRIRALTELGLPVRAVVREMTDEELVIAQGKENGERRDLSFIERALYAVALDERNFKREITMTALSVDKTELSRLIGVGRAVPRFLIDAIGPAPKTGRRRWMELAVLLQEKDFEKVIRPALNSNKFISADSDIRFNLVLALLSPQRIRALKSEWVADDGKKVAVIARHADHVTLALNEKTAPNFGDYLVGRLPDLYREFTGRFPTKT
jgi:ParB family chromosome partitioning protein